MVKKESAKASILSQCAHKVIKPFLDRYGCDFQPQPLPKTYGRGKIKACYANSYRMALRHPVTYVEGLAIHEGAGIAQQHAWCVDDHGKVLDRTWKNGVAYVGVPIKTEFLKRLMSEREQRLEQLGKEMYYGVLDDWTVDFPLINEFGEKPELWLATLRRK